MAAIVWFRRDMRVHDHPALRRALDEHGAIVPFFCLDDRLLHGRHASGPRTQFMLECLADLDRALGGRLVVRRGRPEEELARVAREAGAEDVYFTADVSPFARDRGRRVHERAGLRLHACPGLTVVDDVGALETTTGGPYTVFSPFHRRWEREPRRAVLGAPRKLDGPRLDGAIPSLDELGLRQVLEDPMPGGEEAGRRRLANAARRSTDGSTRLSPHLHFGCVSPLEVEERAPHLARKLAWRDFFHQVLLRYPRNATDEHQERYRDASGLWDYDDERLRAWQDGMTGYPFVDAGMRQLRREGWLPNRLRLVVGSFLTKDLGLDWRLGERWFMRLLLDGDEASNNGNWQWIASVGTDPQPPYRRLYNPTLQMERFDPNGTYVRRYVPEWGTAGYPAPIVDHREARAEALERYRAAVG